jgi:hypothetical protein
MIIAVVFGIWFAVQYYEPNKREAEQEASNQGEAKAIDVLSSERVAYYTKVLAIFTGVISAFGLLQILFLIRTDKTANLAMLTAQRSAGVAKDTLVVGNAAFVFPVDFKWDWNTEADAPDSDIKSYVIRPIWKNSGSTQTKNFESMVAFEFRDSELPIDFDWEILCNNRWLALRRPASTFG